MNNSNTLKEPVNHGTKDFPIKIYHATRLLASYHWHEECEFIYINSGKATIRIGIDNLELEEGQCAYVKSNTLHSISATDKNNLDFFAVVFHPSLLFSEKDVCQKYLSTKYEIKNCFSSVEKELYIINMIQLICETDRNKPFAYELKIKFCLYSILYDIFEKGFYKTNNYNENNKMIIKLESVIQYIHDNYLTNISIDKLAQISGYSISHFTRFFKDLSGKTPLEYINCLKIEHACELLKKTDLSVLEIGLECGYENVGYFIRIFKKYTEFTPHKYRKKYF